MFFSDYTNSDFSFDAAQFGIGIALDFLGEPEASNAVVTFLGTSTKIPTVLQERTGGRENLAQRMKATGAGMLNALLEYLWENPVLTVNAGATQMQGAVKLASLGEIVVGLSKAQVYAKSMEILVRTKENKLIHTYTFTSCFKTAFSKHVRKKMCLSADGVHLNDLSDGIIEEVREDYSDWLNKYSANGAYQLRTGTPLAYCKHVFNSYYMISAVSNLYSILNMRGQNNEISDGQKTTALDLVGVTGEQRRKFDFVKVCTKINAASRLLFTHNSSVAFYDIYSCYFDSVHGQEAEARKALLSRMNGCTFKLERSSQGYAVGCASTITNKTAGRVSICSVMERVVTHGIRAEDVYKLYEEVLRKTDMLPVKDGARLFTTDSYSTRHRESNSQMFATLYEGYLALRELLVYLEGDGSSIVSSPGRVPPDIFRDASMLRRFHSLEEYIKYGKCVHDMYAEAKYREDSSGYELMSNDRVYDLLLQNQVVKSPLFERLQQVPLSYISEAISNVSVLDKTRQLCESANMLKWQLGQVIPPDSFSRDTLRRLSYGQSFSQLTQVGLKLCQMRGEEDSSMKYKVAFSFCNLLQHVMELEGKPVTDENDYYLLSEPDVKHEFAYILLKSKQTSDEGVATKLAQSYKVRVLAVHTVFELFTGEKQSSECDMDWADLRNMFCANELVQKYFISMNEYLKELSFNKENMFLVLAKAAANTSLLSLPSVAVSCDDFLSVYDNNCQQFLIYNRFNTEEVTKYNESRNTVLIRSFNRAQQLFPKRAEIFGYLLEQVKISVCGTKTASSHLDVGKEIMLERAVDGLLRSTALEACPQRVRQQLETFSFDKLGLLITGTVRLCVNECEYYHSSGYVIRINPVTSVCEYRVMSNNDISVISLQLYGG